MLKLYQLLSLYIWQLGNRDINSKNLSVLERLMSFYLEIISAAVAYLLGSISFARIVTYISTSGKDITEHEIPVDGTDESYKVLSIGANSVSSLLGARFGMVVSIFDILKVFLPTLFFQV